MLRAFLLELGHLHLDHARVAAVAPHRVVGPLPAHLPQQRLIPRANEPDPGAGHSGNRQRKICRQPTNDSRSGSRPSRAAAWAITDRTTKCPSDKAYNSCNTPCGVWLRRSADLVT